MSQWHDNSDTPPFVAFVMRASPRQAHSTRLNGSLLGSQCVIHRARLRDLAIRRERIEREDAKKERISCMRDDASRDN